MAKPYPGPWVLRSLLFTPGHIDRMARKAAVSAADCVVLDLQDAVPDVDKAQARQTIRALLEEEVFAKKTVFVRVNPLESGQTLKDVNAVACRPLDGFVYPMAYTPNDIIAFDAQLSMKESELGLPRGHFSIIILIETPLAVLNSYPLARASARVVGLLFGCEDYLAETEGQHMENDTSLLFPRSQVVLACRAAGVEPIDTPYVQVHDLEGLKTFAAGARGLGMAGMLAMTPRHIPIIHDTYSPSQAEVAAARKMVDAAEESAREGRGIAVVDGVFVSPPTLKAAHNILKRAQAIENLTALAS
jgi:citrate lyase subunit beta / citryl-CoA lyase